MIILGNNRDRSNTMSDGRHKSLLKLLHRIDQQIADAQALLAKTPTDRHAIDRLEELRAMLRDVESLQGRKRDGGATGPPRDQP